MIDPTLPAISALLDPDWPNRNLQPAARPGAQWRRRTTEWHPGRCVIATFEQPSSGTVWRVDLTADGVALSRPADDPNLPGLRDALERYPDARIVSYKPGSSCVLSRGDGVIRKVFRSGTAAEIASRLSALAEVQDHQGMPRIPQVLGIHTDIDLIEMSFLDGRPLRDVAHDVTLDLDGRADAMRSLGQSLATLSMIDGLDLPTQRIADDVREVGVGLPAMQLAAPALAARVEELARRITMMGAGIPTAEGPAHGALRTDQVVCGEPPGLVDLDGACCSAAERDAANLTAYLWWRGVRHPGESADLEVLAAAMIDGYRRAGLVVDDWRLRVHRASSLLKIATRRYRGLTVGEWHLVPPLVDEADRTTRS